MRYNLREIMLRAWRLYEDGKGLSFAECLHRSWNREKAKPENSARIEAAKAAAGIVEEVKTWAGWKAAGYMVIHGSKALFGCDLIHSSKGDGATYKARFFGASQVEPMTT